MKIYKEQTAYDFEKFPRTSRRKRQFIGNERGKREMCEIVDNYVKEVAKKENIEIAKNLFEKGISFDVVCQCVKSLSFEELKAIFSETQVNE